MTIASSEVQFAAPPIHLEIGGRSTPLSCRELLGVRGELETFGSGKIQFSGVTDHDVYNPTAPFRFNGRTLIAGRVESRRSESATVMLFWRTPSATWEPCPDVAPFPGLQDPCVAIVNDELILGGVRHPVTMADGQTTYQMEFYRGADVRNLEPFLVGPPGMKDVRLVQLRDGRVGVFSRPQGEVGGRGKIGFTKVSSLDELTAEHIVSAPLFAGQFAEDEWGGANEIHVLRNGLLGVLGHIANFDHRRHRHYYGMVFAVDPETCRSTPLRIIAMRSQFPAGPAKRPDLVDVIFSGGMLRNWDGTATLFAGISDAETAYLTMADPFLRYEM